MPSLLPMRVMAGLALTSCALIVVIRSPKFSRAIAYKLILYQNIGPIDRSHSLPFPDTPSALFLENFVVCFLPQSNAVSCYLQAVISQYAGVSSVFWACTISFALYKITSPYFYLTYNPENDFMKFFYFGSALPLLICLIPAVSSGCSPPNLSSF